MIDEFMLDWKNRYKTIRRIVKRNKFIFSLHRRLTDKEYQREKCKMSTCTTKTQKQIHEEMKKYACYWQCPADDYVRYGLFDKQLSMEKILDYVPMHYFYCDYYDQQFGDVTDMNGGDDKWEQYQLFQERGIKTPEVIALIKRNVLQRTNGISFSWEELKSLVADGERLFIKPTDGNSGIDIIVLHKHGNCMLHQGKEVNSFNSLALKSYLTYVVQRGLVQRDDLNRINPSSLNTLRTIVLYENKKARIVAILLRIGRKGGEVDNSGQGGISVEVNLADGTFSSFAGREHGGGQFDRHPDTGYMFKGARIKDWDDIKAKIENIISRIDTYRMIGWDIAIGQDDVYAVEFNLGFGIEHAQTIAGGFRRKLGILR